MDTVGNMNGSANQFSILYDSITPIVTEVTPISAL